MVMMIMMNEAGSVTRSFFPAPLATSPSLAVSQTDHNLPSQPCVDPVAGLGTLDGWGGRSGYDVVLISSPTSSLGNELNF